MVSQFWGVYHCGAIICTPALSKVCFPAGNALFRHRATDCGTPWELRGRFPQGQSTRCGTKAAVVPPQQVRRTTLWPRLPNREQGNRSVLVSQDARGMQSQQGHSPAGQLYVCPKDITPAVVSILVLLLRALCTEPVCGTKGFPATQVLFPVGQNRPS